MKGGRRIVRERIRRLTPDRWRLRMAGSPHSFFRLFSPPGLRVRRRRAVQFPTGRGKASQDHRQGFLDLWIVDLDDGANDAKKPCIFAGSPFGNVRNSPEKFFMEVPRAAEGIA